jgi:chaperonin GroES
MKKLKPTKDRLLVEPIRDETTTVRGIHIPQAHRDSQASIDCLVLGKGPDCKVEVVIGDRVIINRYSGIDVKSGSRSYKIMPPADVLAVVTQ